MLFTKEYWKAFAKMVFLDSFMDILSLYYAIPIFYGMARSFFSINVLRGPLSWTIVLFLLIALFLAGRPIMGKIAALIGGVAGLRLSVWLSLFLFVVFPILLNHITMFVIGWYASRNPESKIIRWLFSLLPVPPVFSYANVPKYKPPK
jgi:hypothetical protein